METKNQIAIGLIILLFISLNFLGCTKQSQPEEDNKIPKSLLNAELASQKIISNLEVIYSQNKDKKELTESKKQKSEDIWKRIDDKVKKIHNNWNHYKSKSSLDNKKLNLADKELNQFTKNTDKKEVILALLNVNQFNLQLAKIYSLYDTEESRRKMIKSYVRNVIYFSRMKDKKREIEVALKKLEGAVTDLQEQVKDKAVKEIITAVEDLKKAAGENNSKVVEIKGRIVLDKLEKIK